MTFPQYPQYPQRPQQPHPQQNPQQPSQYQQQPQYPQPQANPYELWLRRVKSVFSRIGAGMCLMVVIWYALATVLSGMLYQVLHTTNLPNWAVYVASDAPLYLVADRKSTRLELQSPYVISYAVFCLKKKKK